MRTTNLYQMFDNTAGSISGPILSMKNDGPAIREFHGVLAMGRDSLPGSYPKEFKLLWVGIQNEETGEITAPPTGITIIATGHQWLEQNQRDAAAASNANTEAERAVAEAVRQTHARSRGRK